MRPIRQILVLLACALHAQGASPILPTARLGWEETFRISNDAMEVVASPKNGRLLHLSLKGKENLLNQNEGLSGQLPPAEEGDWMNYGGDWLWPVHQGQWKALTGQEWPPLRVMDSLPWKGDAWTEEDGTQVIRLTGTFAPPVSAIVERVFRLAPGNEATLEVEQTINRTKASDLPVSLWQISQVRGATETYLDVNPDSDLENGYRVIAFDQPNEEVLQKVDGALVLFGARNGEFKLGSDGQWIAARRGTQVLVQWSTQPGPEGPLPDGGCSVVLYANAGLGYTEIESQTAEVALPNGEKIHNTLRYRILEIGENDPPDAVIRTLRDALPPRTVVEFSPASPAPEQVLTVRVRNPQGGGVLHWGVNGPSGDWKLPHPALRPEGSEVAGTGMAVETPLPEPVNEISTLELGPFNHPDQWVESVHAVVRWGDQWESREGKNYNVTLKPHPDASQIEWDLKGIEQVTDLLEFNLSSEPAADRLNLFVNGIRQTDQRGGAKTVRLDTTDWTYGAHVLTVRAERNGRVSSATREVWKVPDDIPQLDLPESTPYGATLEKGEAKLHLLAPNARFVEVEWETDTGKGRILMARAGNGRWATVLDLGKDGTLRYRYVVDGTHPFADPWSVDVDWRNSEGGFSHRPEEAWSLAGTLPPPLGPWDRPPMETWVIYELSIPDVAPPGSYKGLTAKLEYIQNMGFNVIEPLPVTVFPGDSSWGYNPAFHRAIERSYGTPAAFAEMVKAARDRGIAFIVDIVLNHADKSSPLIGMHGDPDQNPFTMPFSQFNWGFPKLDQEHPAFKRYLQDVLVHWVDQWGIDGFRYDATQWVKWSGYKDWGVSWMSYVVDQADRDVIQIAENIPGEPDMVKGTALDAEWDAHFRWRMNQVFTKGRIAEPEKFEEILDPRSHAYHSGFERMQYIESHDEQRFLAELKHAGWEEEDALRRHLAATAVTLTVPGIPMIYAGQEWGEETPKVVGLNPLQWDVRNQPARKELLEEVRALVKLRTSHRALHHDRIDVLRVDAETGTVVYRRPGVPESILVALNVSAASATLSLKDVGIPIEELGHEKVPEDFLNLTLLPGEARVFRVK